VRYARPWPGDPRQSAGAPARSYPAFRAKRPLQHRLRSPARPVPAGWQRLDIAEIIALAGERLGGPHQPLDVEVERRIGRRQLLVGQQGVTPVAGARKHGDEIARDADTLRRDIAIERHGERAQIPAFGCRLATRPLQLDRPPEHGDRFPVGGLGFGLPPRIAGQGRAELRPDLRGIGEDRWLSGVASAALTAAARPGQIQPSR
jgi:hypothetical protein